jgi:hypothetical protein
MAISDLFSTSFLFSIAIIIILIGGIFAYVSYRMAEQDHKLTTMVNLVSILAQDLQMVRSKVVSMQQQDNPNVEYPSQMMGGQETSDLISVSDDGDDDEEEEEDIDDNTTDEEESYSSEDDTDDDEEGELQDSQEQIKLLNLTLVNEDVENDSPIEDLNCDFYNEVKELDTPHKEDIKTIHLETPITFEESEIPEPLEGESDPTDVNISSEDISFITNGSYALKNVTITEFGGGLGEIGESEDLHASKSEYKKMSLTKLREVAVSKGVVADASKLKKNEILKMLGDE